MILIISWLKLINNLAGQGGVKLCQGWSGMSEVVPGWSGMNEVVPGWSGMNEVVPGQGKEAASNMASMDGERKCC